MSPGRTRDLMARFSPWVALKVKTTCSGSGTSKRAAASSRQAKAVSAAAIAGRCPPRPGLARWQMAQALARATSGGFCKVVAALSR